MAKMTEEDLNRLKAIIKEKLKMIVETLDESLTSLFKRRMAFMLIIHEKRIDQDFTVTLTNIEDKENKLDCLNKAAEMVQEPNVVSSDGFTHTIQ